MSQAPGKKSYSGAELELPNSILTGDGPDATPAEAGLPHRPHDTWFNRHESQIIGTAAVVVFLVLWQAEAWARLVPELFLPGPIDVARAMVALFQNEPMATHIATSGQEFGIGFALAILIGLPIGLLMGWYRRVHHALDPFVSFFYSMPRVALAPLLIIWLGIGIWSKVALVFLGAFFPIAINTMSGVRSLDSSLLRAARSFGARDAQIFRTIALPGSVPFILSGIRLGLGHALVGIVVGELIAAQYGLGLVLEQAGATFQTSKEFAVLVLIAGTGLFFQVVLRRLERRFDAWRPRQ